MNEDENTEIVLSFHFPQLSQVTNNSVTVLLVPQIP